MTVSSTTPTSDEPIHMKVSCKHPIVFYIKSALSFFKGTSHEDKPAVNDLKISGLGNAINVAIAAASRCEKEGMGTIEKIVTNYVTVMTHNKERQCPQVEISLKRHPDADKIKESDIKDVEEDGEEEEEEEEE